MANCTFRKWVLFEQIWATDKNDHATRMCVTLYSLGRIRTTDKNNWLWIQKVSCSPLFLQMRTTNENDWTHIQPVSHFPVFGQMSIADKNGIHLVCELLFSVWLDQNSWLEWLNICPGCESLSVFKQIRRTADENFWTHFQYVSCSPVLEQIKADQNH